LDVTRSGIFSIRLSIGIPDDVWIWLTNAEGWIDYCNLNSMLGDRSPRVDACVKLCAISRSGQAVESFASAK